MGGAERPDEVWEPVSGAALVSHPCDPGPASAVLGPPLATKAGPCLQRVRWYSKPDDLGQISSPLLFLLRSPTGNTSCAPAPGRRLAPLRARKANRAITEKEGKAGSHIHRAGWCFAHLFVGCPGPLPSISPVLLDARGAGKGLVVDALGGPER